MNLISINFATQFPSPLQVLQRTDSLLTFGLRRDIESFLTAHNGQMMATAHSIRFQQFCRELIRYYVVCCAVPKCLVGARLSEMKLSALGINVVALGINGVLTVQRPLDMIEHELCAGDWLLCLFNRADEKLCKLHCALNRAAEQHKRQL